MSIEKQLADHLAAIGTAPFLFIGSGMSRRYIGLEDWKALLKKFSAGLPQPFEYYYGQANRDLPQTAALIANDFYNIWWNDPAYQASRDAFKDDVVSQSSCLKYEIAKYMIGRSYAPGADAAMDAEILLLKKATVDGIITTNWDTSLESFFPDFEVFVGQSEILFASSQGIAEIYKIHGCSTAPNSLVLTTDDYADFNRRNPYLAAKLLTIFVEHPVILLGYSLSDENITEILSQITSCLTTSDIGKLKDRLIFVQRDSAGKGDSFESSVIKIGSFPLPVTIIRTNDLSQVYRPLGNLKRKFSARLLRNMKEHIYELVLENDPKGKLAVLDINEADSFEDLEVVYGVGVLPKLGEQGYSPISRVDLLKDVMTPTSEYDAARIVAETLPGLCRETMNVPVFRYLRAASRIQSDGTIDETGLHARVIKAAKRTHDDFYPPAQYRGELNEVQNGCASVLGVMLRYSGNSFFYFPLLRKDQIVVDDLEKYIVANMKLVNDKSNVTQTYFRKLICFYDWLKYR